MPSLLSLGARAMFANQAALQTVGNNIANANTPGYSRQSVVLTTAPGQYTGAGFFGRGVDVQTIERAHDQFLTRQAAATKSAAAGDATRSDLLTRLGKVLPLGADGLGYAASQFLNAMQDVASRPSDPSARQVVLGRASDLAARFRDAGGQIEAMQAGIVGDLRNGVQRVNDLAQQIARINDQIASNRGSGHEPNDLLDQREQLVSKLSEFISVTTVPADDGTLGVFIGGGQRLVLGNSASALQVTPDAYDPNRAVLTMSDGHLQRSLDESVLTGGTLAAMLRVQNRDLVDARNMLGQLAAAIGTRVNDQNALGLDLSTPARTGGNIFSVAAPRVLPSTNNPSAALPQVSITDATQLQASNYLLKVTAGGYEITQLPDGKPIPFVNGDTVDGVKISFPASPAPQVGDSFIIEPVGMAASGMNVVLDSPNGIAAASPLTATSNVANTGTLSIQSIYAVNGNFSATTAAQLPLTLTFGTANPDGSVNYSLSNGQTGVWRAGQPIGNDAPPGIDLGFQLNTSGVPRSGDSLTIDPTKYTGANNGNAKAFLGLQTEAFVGRQQQRDANGVLLLDANGNPVMKPGATVTDAYAADLSDLGARSQSATYLSGVSAGVASSAEQARSSVAGVNLDEEAARLMQFQQGYQAAARVLQTAQSLFDELLRLAQH
ncbi:flagellar hook-associated protein FlgK [Roseateles sp.]|uniref:flagellar hook-associated protein FlgK n=1 Tax=Roseateles sp. TaxID=1971397 RepID=UPI0025EAA870|nr:flagellar hook-associated protein FlgK [Roseateles sp.]MBV8034972.1 flagellar hook-associated protein FlgK [Roseateles sp.]